MHVQTRFAHPWSTAGIIGGTFTLLFLFGVIPIPELPLRAGAGEAAPRGYDHPLLNNASEAELTAGGVDLRSIPTVISRTQETCAVTALGQERVDAIKGGATVTMSDYALAKHCISTWASGYLGER
ncbi:hypothetical protein HYS28_01545 [Candidatus Uhrbacteria bacterium]|nr:hypothetical protein [Candidatus Uhrbacteria bacterium]